MIKPKTRITSFSQTGVLPSGYHLLLHWPSANEKRQRDNENCYETTWMTPIKFRITRVPITAAASGRKLIIVLYILFIVVLCSLFTVSGPEVKLGWFPTIPCHLRALNVYRLRWENSQAFFSSTSFLHAAIRVLLWPVLISKQYRPTRNGN